MSETRRSAKRNHRGYFGIGIENNKTPENLGTLWRTAYVLGASFIFTIGRRYDRQPSDTYNVAKHIPIFSYGDFEHFYFSGIPSDCVLIGAELLSEAKSLREYSHPERAIYLLGSEDNGLSKIALDKCHRLIVLPGNRSLNVAVAGSIIMYDRLVKRGENA